MLFEDAMRLLYCMELVLGAGLFKTRVISHQKTRVMIYDL